MEEKSILIADPDRQMVHEILRAFEKEPISFIRALNSNELVEWLKICSPDLLLASSELPDIEILELIAIIKIIRPGMPIIVMTQEESIGIDTEKKLRQEGIFYLFVKSFGTEELKIAIINALNLHQHKLPGG